VTSDTPTKTFAECGELRDMAVRFFWWQSPEEVFMYPRRFVARIMDLGGFADYAAIERHFGVDEMREAVVKAEPGWFRERSWYFWHYRLGLTSPGEEPPPMPERKYE